MRYSSDGLEDANYSVTYPIYQSVTDPNKINKQSVKLLMCILGYGKGIILSARAHRQTDRETDRETETERDVERETDRQTERKRDRQ